MTSIDEQVEKMPKEEQERFNFLLMDVLHDRGWCMLHQIDYVNPDVAKTKEKIYNLYFKDEPSK